MRKFALIMAIALTFVGLISYICTPSPVTSPQSWERHYVSEGDTLWDIATAIPHKGVKLNDVIDDIVEFNSLGEYLYAGEVIYIPVY